MKREQLLIRSRTKEDICTVLHACAIVSVTEYECRCALGNHPYLQSDLTGQLRVAAHLEELMLCAHRTKFWEIASRLAHDPHRHALNLLAPRGTQEEIVLKSKLGEESALRDAMVK